MGRIFLSDPIFIRENTEVFFTYKKKVDDFEECLFLLPRVETPRKVLVYPTTYIDFIDFANEYNRSIGVKHTTPGIATVRFEGCKA